MLTNSFVTVFRLNEETDDYEKLGCFSAWVFSKRQNVKTENGERSGSTVHIRISLSSCCTARPDDLIAVGKDLEFSAADCSKITAVTTNNFGLQPHIHIEAGGN